MDFFGARRLFRPFDDFASDGRNTALRPRLCSLCRLWAAEGMHTPRRLAIGIADTPNFIFLPPFSTRRMIDAIKKPVFWTGFFDRFLENSGISSQIIPIEKSCHYLRTISVAAETPVIFVPPSVFPLETTPESEQIAAVFVSNLSF